MQGGVNYTGTKRQKKWVMGNLTHCTAQVITNTTTEIKINNMHQTSSISDLIQYLHAAYFIPVLSTWIEAIDDGFFNNGQY